MGKWINRGTNEIGISGAEERGNNSNESNLNLRIFVKMKDVKEVIFRILRIFNKHIHIYRHTYILYIYTLYIYIIYYIHDIYYMLYLIKF